MLNQKDVEWVKYFFKDQEIHVAKDENIQGNLVVGLDEYEWLKRQEEKYAFLNWEKGNEKEIEFPLSYGTPSEDAEKPFSLLVTGSMFPNNPYCGISDINVWLGIVPTEKKILMVSLPSTLRIQNQKTKEDDFLGFTKQEGIVNLVDSIGKYFDYPLSDFLAFDMDKVEELIDTLKGVKIQNDQEFTYEGVHYPKGEITLKGKEALTYMIALNDEVDESMRMRNQIELLEGMFGSLNTPAILLKALSLLHAITGLAKTNMSMNRIVKVKDFLLENMNEVDVKILYYEGNPGTIKKDWARDEFRCQNTNDIEYNKIKKEIFTAMKREME